MSTPRAEQLEPVVYDRNAILTIEQVARGLSISVRSVERADLPTFYVGRLRRYLWGKVLDTIDGRSQ
ncbi:MAG TPA: hypothetical protein VN717_07520 [Gemmatimonadaceae bacterium]|nr:hypothetical protein [Gemmatimonadaceae bacterium]